MKILIIGGGFGGIKTALELAKHQGFEVVLISNKEYFTYYPALYSVATGGSQRQSFVPLEQIFENTSVKVVHDTIEGYDPQRRLVRGSHGAYHYDRIVFSLGVVTSYFGIKGLDRYSFGIKTAEELARFRHHIHDEMVEDKKIDKQYVVIGAGPTGIEVASSLAFYVDHIASSHAIRHTKIRVKLVEAADRVAPRLSPQTSQLIAKRLKQLGVQLLLNEKVECQDSEEVFVGGRAIPTHTVIWTSGVANNPFFAQHNHHFALSPNQRVIVDDHMMADAHTYVIGDNAYTPYSGLAQTALHDAIYVARDIVRASRKHPRPSYKVVQPPVVLPVGKRWAVLEYKSLRVHGYIGHLIRRTADFVGYHDILPLGLAFSSWSAEYTHDNQCKECQQLPY